MTNSQVCGMLFGKRVVHVKHDSLGQLHIYYDGNRPDMVTYNGATYRYVHSLQGDILGLQDGAGNFVVQYYYDAWGRQIAKYGTLESTLGTLNPLRYRGYVYDEDLGLYYLRSRYYSPWWGRFLSADSILGQVGTLLQHNPFSYCSNNPIIRVDVLGEAFEVVFDLVSVASSIFEVSRNPSDPTAWFALAGDFIDVVVPFVSGVGEAVRLFRVGEKVVDAVDDVYDTGKTIQRIHGNSLLSNKINYGYQLYEETKGRILKYGESKNPNLRYTKTFLESHGYKVEIKVAGTKRGVHEWQHDMITGYSYIAGERPPMNRSLW